MSAEDELLYQLNDTLSEWALAEGLHVTDEQLNDAVHEALRILRGEPFTVITVPEKKPSALQRWLRKNK